MIKTSVKKEKGDLNRAKHNSQSKQKQRNLSFVFLHKHTCQYMRGTDIVSDL